MNVAELSVRWPSLRSPAPPVPPPRPVDGEHRFDVAADWASLVEQVERGEFRLRAPTSGPGGLIGPVRGHGTCLAPVFQGDAYYFDPHMAAQAGDFVWVQLHPTTLAGIVERGRSDPAWVSMYGAAPADHCVKRLVDVGGQLWLTCNESTFPLGASWFGGANKVLGVVRYVERRGQPIYGSGAPTLEEATSSLIEANAATIVASVTDTLESVAKGTGSFDSGFVWVKYVTIDVASDDVVEVATQTRLGVLATPGFTVYSGAAFSHSDGSGASLSAPVEKDDNLYSPVSHVGTFGPGYSGSFRYGIGCQMTHASNDQVEAFFRDISIQVTRVRR